MKQVLYACGCFCLLSVGWLALDLRTAVLELRTDAAIVTANVTSVSQSAVRTADAQNLYWKATSLQTSRLIGQARHTMADVDDSVKSLNIAIEATNASLNGDKGVLPHLSSVAEITEAQAIELSAHGTATLDEARDALHNTARTAEASAKLLEQVTPPAVATIQHADQISGSAAHVADHYDHVLTDKQTTWQQVKSWLWFPIKVALRVW